MLNQVTAQTSTFLSHSSALIPIINNHFSIHAPILVSKSLSIDKQLVVPIEEADANCITVENFLVVLDERLQQELAYQKELMQLKESICDEYNKLCVNETDQQHMKFIRNQRQKVIDCLFESAKPDEKMIAEKFYNQITNGFEEEAMNNLDEIARKAICKTLVGVVPMGIVPNVKEILNQIGESKTKISIQDATLKIIDCIKTQTQIIDISGCNYTSCNDLFNAFKQVAEQKTVCNAKIIGLFEYQEIIAEYQSKCINMTEVTVDIEELLAENIKIVVDSLILKGKAKKSGIVNICSKLQRGLQKLSISFECKTLIECEIVQKNYFKIKLVNLLKP